MGASMRYLSQRFAMQNDEVKAILNDIGTEELAHLEMVGSLVHQLTKMQLLLKLKTVPLQPISLTTARAFGPPLPQARHLPQ